MCAVKTIQNKNFFFNCKRYIFLLKRKFPILSKSRYLSACSLPQGVWMFFAIRRAILVVFFIFELMLIMTRSCYITIVANVWPCFTVELSLVPLFWSCFTIEKSNATPANKFEQELVIMIILNMDKIPGIKQFDWLNFLPQSCQLNVQVLLL